MTTGVRNPGSEPLGSASDAHQISVLFASHTKPIGEGVRCLKNGVQYRDGCFHGFQHNYGYTYVSRIVQQPSIYGFRKPDTINVRKANHPDSLWTQTTKNCVTKMLYFRII